MNVSYLNRFYPKDQGSNMFVEHRHTQIPRPFIDSPNKASLVHEVHSNEASPPPAFLSIHSSVSSSVEPLNPSFFHSIKLLFVLSRPSSNCHFFSPSFV